MRRKKVWRYYCEYCKKAGCSGRHIKKHEERCTLNPNRTCGFCGLSGMPQPIISDLLILLPNPEDYLKIDAEFGFRSYVGLTEVVGKALPKLREATENCPACIMAALRQKGIPVPIAKDFDFKKECAGAWDDYNEARRQENYSCY